ncbi:MAG: aminoglycoside phosphotransferase [Oleiphilus sp.]|nr:MAG: aminoglycoside phosphotransferase [Oleiphilus sp.]
MRRFPQDQLLSELAEKNDLDPALIIDLAECVADFHMNAAERTPAGSTLGRAESMYHWFNENFDQIKPLVKDPSTLEALSDLKVWGEEQYKQNQELLTRRQHQGFVRECHGDLHLGNIVSIDNLPVCFDCIEFNDEFRWIDTMNEVAFLLMDLDHRGRSRAAGKFLNHYLNITGDYDGLALLNYYRVYRALVRAKVSLLKQSPPYDFSEFDRYLELSLSYTKAVKPMLIITHGVSGSGKSYWSERIAREVGAIHIRSDIERKRLLGLSADHHGGSSTMQGIYTSEITRKTYERLKHISSLILRAGFTVIVDATFLSISDRSTFKSLAETCQVKFLILAFSTDDATLRQRIQQRIVKNNDPSEANEEILNYQVTNMERLLEEEFLQALIIDNKKEVDLKRLVSQIGSNG